LSGAQLPGADLLGAQLHGADLSLAQLTDAELYRAQLTGADLTGVQLSGANLSGAQLAGANLSGAQLTGAILEDIKFEPINEKEANAQVDNLFSALKDLLQYRGNDELMDEFRRRITSFVDFSKLAGSEGCLATESALKHLPLCKKIGDPKTQKIAYEIWVRLACQDNTEKHWVAQGMVRRANKPRDFFNSNSNGLRFPYFASLLAAKLQTPDKCPGLAGLDDKSKKILLDAAKKGPKSTRSK
jgi:hypothetical protein